MPSGPGTYGSKVGRPPKKKLKDTCTGEKFIPDHQQMELMQIKMLKSLTKPCEEQVQLPKELNFSDKLCQHCGHACHHTNGGSCTSCDCNNCEHELEKTVEFEADFDLTIH